MTPKIFLANIKKKNEERFRSLCRRVHVEAFYEVISFRLRSSTNQYSPSAGFIAIGIWNGSYKDLSKRTFIRGRSASFVVCSRIDCFRRNNNTNNNSNLVPIVWLTNLLSNPIQSNPIHCYSIHHPIPIPLFLRAACCYVLQVHHAR